MGEAAACPSCFSLLRIPATLEDAPKIYPHAAGEMTSARGSHFSEVYSDDWREEIPSHLLQEYAGKMPWHMLIPASVLGITLFLAVLLELHKTEYRSAEVVAQKVQQGVVGESEISDEATDEELVAFCEKLTTVRTVEELEQLVLPVDGIAEKLDGYYKSHEVEFSEFGELKYSRKLKNMSQRFILTVESKDKRTFLNYLIYRTKSGQLLLDWESYVRYCSTPWEELRELQPTEPQTVRVLCRKVEYYNNEYSSKDWQSFEVTHAHSDVVHIGYVNRKSVAYVKLLPIGNVTNSVEMTLTIRYPEDAQSARQFIIEEVVATNWITEFTE